MERGTRRLGADAPLSPFTVMVPEHYAAFMREMDEALTDHSYVRTTSLAENPINYNDGEAVEQVFGWDFDTEQERLAACDAISAAVLRLRVADAKIHAAEVPA